MDSFPHRWELSVPILARVDYLVNLHSILRAEKRGIFTPCLDVFPSELEKERWGTGQHISM